MLDQRNFNKMLPKLTLVLGGAASGKSAFAENLLLSSPLRPVYVATGQAFDDETQQKINVHKARRGVEWRLIEAPHDLEDPLASIDLAEGVLLDCATMWLSNRLLAEAPMDAASADFLAALACCPAPIVVVSNELGQGIVPENAMARAFREDHGRLNIAIAQKADLVVSVIAGLPQVLKGELP